MSSADTDRELAEILTSSKTIALVGASPKENRPSYKVMAYLQQAGYKVLPINPGQEGKQILGEPVFANLAQIDQQVDIVDIFRRAEFVPEIVEQAIVLKAKTIWMQLDIKNDEAALTAQEAGLNVVMDHCTKIEHARLITSS
ncbi:MAG: CoA-binding protein [Hyphomicrobiaceae bacterium]|nr:CoA-binding protein [Hyphomicrobiaceae bacterium]